MLEALLRSDSEDAEEYFCEHADNLEALEKGANTQMAVKAVEVSISFLGCG